ncbi:hypothetical protein BGZ46_003848 [Entomortierella lignicola]|nr:hypothetical protein BGZ46_003848 [Entomortierella lignicola]
MPNQDISTLLKFVVGVCGLLIRFSENVNVDEDLVEKIKSATGMIDLSQMSQPNQHSVPPSQDQTAGILRQPTPLEGRQRPSVNMNVSSTKDDYPLSPRMDSVEDDDLPSLRLSPIQDDDLPPLGSDLTQASDLHSLIPDLIQDDDLPSPGLNPVLILSTSSNCPNQLKINSHKKPQLSSPPPSITLSHSFTGDSPSETTLVNDDEYPDGDVTFSRTAGANDKKYESRGVGWAMCVHGHNKLKRSQVITHYKYCLGIHQCPERGCRFIDRPIQPDRKRKNCPPPPSKRSCVLHKTQLEHISCEATLEVTTFGNTFKFKHKGFHKHARPDPIRSTPTAKREFSSMIGAAPDDPPKKILKGTIVP